MASELSLPEYLRNRLLFGKYFGGLVAYLVLEQELRRRFFIHKFQTEYHIPKNKGERSDIILHTGKGQLIPIMGLWNLTGVWVWWVKDIPCSCRKVLGWSAASSWGMNPVRLFTLIPVNQLMFVKHFKLEKHSYKYLVLSYNYTTTSQLNAQLAMLQSCNWSVTRSISNVGISLCWWSSRLVCKPAAKWGLLILETLETHCLIRMNVSVHRTEIHFFHNYKYR